MIRSITHQWICRALGATLLLTLSFSGVSGAWQAKAPRKTAVAESAVPTAKPAVKPGAAADDDDEKTPATDSTDPLMKKGLLEQLAKPLDELVDLQWSGNHLSLQLKSGHEDFQAFANSVRQVAGYGGGSSYGGDGSFEATLNSPKMNGFVRRKRIKGRFESSIMLEESEEPARSLRIWVRDSGETSITISAIESAYLLRIRQQPSGALVVQELKGTEAFADYADNFDQFIRRHRQFCETRLLPLWKRFGIGQIVSPYSEEVRNQFLKLIGPWEPEQIDLVRELTAPLNAKRFQERESAARRLQEQFGEHEAVLTRAILDKQFPVEIRVRLRKLVNEKLAPEKRARLELVRRLIDKADVDYLVWLIQTAADEAQRDRVVKRINDQLGKSLGSTEGDVQAFIVSHTQKNWTSSGPSKPEAAANANPLNETGALQKVAANTRQLIRLAWNSDQLAIDRQHWQKPFGGREIKDLIAEVEQKLANNHLPAKWFNGGGASYSASSAQHPQVLFELLEQASQGNAVSSSRYYRNYAGSSTPNRQFENSLLRGKLFFEKNSSSSRRSTDTPARLDRKPLLFMLTEVKKPSRTLLVHEPKPGQLHLRVLSESSNMIVQLIQNDKQAVVQYLHGRAIVAHQAKTFRELQTQNQAFFRDRFFPLLRHLGIEVADDVQAPADANEVTGGSVESLDEIPVVTDLENREGKK